MDLNRPKTRRAFSTSGAMLTTGALLLAVGGGYFALRSFTGVAREDEIATREIARDRFIFTVKETGEVESSSNVEVRCEVKSRNSSGTTILEIVPEGTYVQEGDFLLQLDSSALELDLNAQQILVHSGDAAVIQAENDYETAKIAKIEYLEGTFKQEAKTIQSEIFVAEEDLRRAEQYYQYSKRLAAKGYVTQLQLDADRFAVDKAKEDLDNARTKLSVLREFTKKKMLTQLESDINSTFAKLQSARSSHELDVNKLNDIKAQIKKCRITAPKAGQVKYNNKRSYRGSDEVIEAGIQVREGQTIIRLPDAKQMQVVADINESRTKFVRVGMPATILVRSVSPEKLHGTVVKVNDYPEPSSFFSSNVKEYATTIEIHDSDSKLKPGLTAEVEIFVAELKNVVEAPLQSVVEHGGDFYCIAQSTNVWQLRPVEIGLNNDETVVIKSGLTEGDIVVENPRRHRQLVTWPDIEDKQPDRRAPGQQPAAPALAGNTRRTANKPKAPAPPVAKSPTAAVAGLMSRLDGDSDGRLSTKELAAAPGQLRERLQKADANGDGVVERSELQQAFSRSRGGGQ